MIFAREGGMDPKKRQSAFKGPSMEILLEALLQLQPSEVDALRFVNHAYNKLIEQHGARLPKHTINLFNVSLWDGLENEDYHDPAQTPLRLPEVLAGLLPKYVPLQNDEGNERERVVAWMEEEKNHPIQLTEGWLKLVLRDKRVGLIACLVLRGDPDPGFINVLHSQGGEVPVERVRLDRPLKDIHAMVDLATYSLHPYYLEAFIETSILRYSSANLYQHISHFIYHVPSCSHISSWARQLDRATSQPIFDFLFQARRRGSVVLHLTTKDLFGGIAYDCSTPWHNEILLAHFPMHVSLSSKSSFSQFSQRFPCPVSLFSLEFAFIVQQPNSR